tara:strand:- start:717 stop:938 length:222 start_codon:yes stop_codon:yes gene_type:complete
MFSNEPFSVVSFGDDGLGSSATPGLPGPVLYFNNKTLTFPLRINKVSEFDSNVNRALELSLNRNTVLDFVVRR